MQQYDFRRKSYNTAYALFLKYKPVRKYRATILGGKLVRISKSQHRSKAGVKYNKLLRFRRRVLCQ